jgi:hypothetical protein
MNVNDSMNEGAVRVARREHENEAGVMCVRGVKLLLGVAVCVLVCCE